MSDLTDSFSHDPRSFINIDTYETVEQSPQYIRSSNGNGYVCCMLLQHFLLLLFPGVKYLPDTAIWLFTITSSIINTAV